MAVRLSLNEILNELTSLIKTKDAEVVALYQKAYVLFRQIIIYPGRELAPDIKKMRDLAESIHDFMAKMRSTIPGTIKNLNENKDISRESKIQQRGLLLNTKGLNELLCILESIAIELTRDESYDSNAASKAQLTALVENAKTISRETREFVLELEALTQAKATVMLYTIETRSIGLALIMVYSFTVAFNLSIIRLRQGAYEKDIDLPKSYDAYTDLLLPLFVIPGYIMLHYLSTRLNLKASFMLSIFVLIIGNGLYYAAFAMDNVWFYLIGKAIIVSRLPMYGVKQFIGFYTKAKDRVKISTCSIAMVFLGLSCGYFLSLATRDYKGSFLGMTTNGENFGGLLMAGSWLIIAMFCGVLFVSPDDPDKEAGHPNLAIQALTIVSYILPFIVFQAFASNHSLPKDIDWDAEKFYTFLGVFCLMAVPIHLIVYISSYFTTNISLIVSSKVICIVGAGIQTIMYVEENSKEFWYVVGAMLITMGVNIGIGVNFAMLAGNVRNHRVGLFSGVLEIMGILIGNLAVEYRDALVFTQPAVVGVVVLTLGFDIGLYSKFNPLRDTKVGDSSKEKTD